MNRKVFTIVGLALLAIGIFLLFQTVTATSTDALISGETVGCGSIYSGTDHGTDCAPVVNHQWDMARGFLGAGVIVLLGVVLLAGGRRNPPGPALF